MSETLLIKNKRVNSPHILSSGMYEATLVGEGIESFAEQLLTPVPIGIRHPRGAVRVLLQCEYAFGGFLSSGQGMFNLYHQMVDNTAFKIYAIHNLPNGVTRTIRINWFAVGYEDYEDTTDVTTAGTVGSGSSGPYSYPVQQTFIGATTTVTLDYNPVDDATLIVWADRIAMFNGEDFTVNGKVVTFNPALTGTEAVVVHYTWRQEDQ